MKDPSADRNVSKKKKRRSTDVEKEVAGKKMCCSNSKSANNPIPPVYDGRSVKDAEKRVKKKKKDCIEGKMMEDTIVKKRKKHRPKESTAAQNVQIDPTDGGNKVTSETGSREVLKRKLQNAEITSTAECLGKKTKVVEQTSLTSVETKSVDNTDKVAVNNHPDGKRRKKHKRNRDVSMKKKAKKIFHSLLTENPIKESKDIKELEGEDPDPSKEESNKLTAKKEPKRKKRKDDQKKDPNEPKEVEKDTKKMGIEYLQTWKTDKINWHFQKSRQLWLIRNIYNDDAIDDNNFSSLLEYLEGSKGGVRTRLIENAQAIQNSVSDGSDDTFDQVKVNRAKEILQMLSE